MNTEKDNHLGGPEDCEYILLSDDEARELLVAEIPKTQEGLILLEIAKKAASIYSFVGYQTYPRPSHALEDKRLSSQFTFVAIITSLRCTLETEQLVVDRIIRLTGGSIDKLHSVSESTFLNLLRPAGMATKKSKWITEGLVVLSSKQDFFVENLKNMPINDVRAKLLSLRGMGPKAVDCFMLLGLNMPVFPVDVNVFKMVSTLFPERVTGSFLVVPKFTNTQHVMAVKQLLEASFTQDTKLYQVLHTYLLLAQKYKIVK